jgi:O-antigen ligase
VRPATWRLLAERRATWPLALFGVDLLWQGLALPFWSVAPHDTFASIVRTAAAAALFAVAAGLPDGRSVRLAGWTLVAAAVLQGLYGALMVLSGVEWGLLAPKEHFLGSATGTFVNRNHYAGWLALCLAVGIGLMLADLDDEGDEGRSWRARLRALVSATLSRKGPLRIALVLVVVGIVLSRSRMGNFAMVVSLNAGFLALFLLRRRVGGGIGLLFASLLAVDLVLAGSFFGLDEVAERLRQTNAMAETRDEVAVLVLGMIADHPWLGTGPGTFYAAFPAYRDETITGFYRHAHNDYLQFLAERGVPGVLPLLGVVALALRNAVGALRRRSALARGLGFAVVMATVYTALHALVDFNLQITANGWLFAAVLGLAWPARHLHTGRRSGRGPPRRHRNPRSRRERSAGA